MPTAPTSPPKRMTRARAKAVEEKQNVKTIITPAAKAAKSAATKSTKRKTPDDEELAFPEFAPIGGPKLEARAEVQQSAKPTKVPIRRTGRKQAETEGVSDQQDAKVANKDAAAKPRGRPRKNTITADPPQAALAPEKPIPSTRATRARAEANARSQHEAAPPKKKVTFKDEDKENIVDPSKTKTKDGKAMKKPTVTALKPVRKPATKPAAKPAASEQGKALSKDEAWHENRPQPLSPSKGVQTNAPPQHGSPVKDASTKQHLLSSPKKLPLEKQRKHDDDVFGDCVDELQASDPVAQSPTKPSGTSIVGSPARRPPPSPFKHAMKTSPVRLAMRPSRDVLEDTKMNLDEPTLSQSPKKFNLGGAPAQPVFKVPQSNQLGNSMFQSPARRPASPTKAFEPQAPAATPYSATKISMLQSPARRPPSVIKSAGLSSSRKANGENLTMTAMTASIIRQSPQKITLTTGKTLTSALKASRAPDSSVKVHTTTAEEKQADTLMGELEHAALPSAPSEHENTDMAMRPKSSDGPPSAKSEKASKIPVRSPPRSLGRTVIDTEIASTPSNVQLLDLIGTAAPTPADSPAEAFKFKSPGFQWDLADESEDELQTKDPQYDASPERRKSKAFLDDTVAPTPSARATPAAQPPDTAKVSMTALADRFGAWTGASPDAQVLARRRHERSVFLPIKRHALSTQAQTEDQSALQALKTPSSFTEAMDIREDNDEDELMPDAPSMVEDVFRQSQISDASQEYGDENALPVDPALLLPTVTEPITCTPARVYPRSTQQISHTVSKVPLKPAAEDGESPLVRPKTRRPHSISGPLAPRVDIDLEALVQKHQSCSVSRSSKFVEEVESSASASEPATPVAKSDKWSVSGTPARTPRSDVNSKLLSGAVVHVDVYTTEGADASGIFVDLLGQMGAKCVKQWSWNPTSGSTSADAGDSRVGITHVVFKDGGKRTMEKVREAKGLVQCVGVGWVLE